MQKLQHNPWIRSVLMAIAVSATTCATCAHAQEITVGELRASGEQTQVMPAEPDGNYEARIRSGLGAWCYESRLRSAGRKWQRIGGRPRAGMYVEDLIPSRPNQPPGRGVIAKVVIVGTTTEDAWVDFGVHWMVHLPLSEVALLQVDGMESEPQPSAASIESELSAQGKAWQRIPGTIKVGDYVEDLLKNRMNQPPGRGFVGKVVAVGWVNSTPLAWVDFGRGNVSNIQFSELSRVQVVPGGVVAGKSVEAHLIAQGKRWTVSSGEIKPGTYVKDILVGRSNQPANRGNIAKVVAIAADDGFECAWADFGQSWIVAISITELRPIRFVGGSEAPHKLTAPAPQDLENTLIKDL